MCPEILVTFSADWFCNGEKPDFAETALRRYEATGKELDGIPSLAEQRGLMSTVNDMAGASMFVVDGASVCEFAKKDVELTGTAVDDNENADSKEMMTVKEVENTGLRDKP